MILQSNISTNLSKLIEQSIKAVQAQVTGNIFVLSATLFNLISCIVTIRVLMAKNPVFKTRTFAMIKIFLVNDLCLSIYITSCILFHLFNALNQRPELFLQHECFATIGSSLFFVQNNVFLDFVIGLGRVYVILNPSKDVQFKVSKKFCILMALPFVASIFIFIICHLDTFDEVNLMIYCSNRNSPGQHMTAPLRLISVFVGMLTFCIYIVASFFARFKSTKIAPIPNNLTGSTLNQQNSNLPSLQIRRFKRLTKILALIAVIHFITGPFSTASTAYLVSISPEMVLKYGSTVAWMNFIESSTYTVSLMFMKDFRQQFFKIYSKAFCGYGRAAAGGTVINGNTLQMMSMRN